MCFEIWLVSFLFAILKDEKEVKIEEYEREIKELKGKTATVVQMKMLGEARLKDQVIMVYLWREGELVWNTDCQA